MDATGLFIAGILFGAPIGIWLARKPKPVEALRLVPAVVQCAKEDCGSTVDTRCVGGNCSEHCQSAFGCRGRCLDVWAAKALKG